MSIDIIELLSIDDRSIKLTNICEICLLNAVLEHVGGELGRNFASSTTAIAADAATTTTAVTTTINITVTIIIYIIKMKKRRKNRSPKFPT